MKLEKEAIVQKISLVTNRESESWSFGAVVQPTLATYVSLSKHVVFRNSVKTLHEQLHLQWSTDIISKTYTVLQIIRYDVIKFFAYFSYILLDSFWHLRWSSDFIFLHKFFTIVGCLDDQHARILQSYRVSFRPIAALSDQPLSTLIHLKDVISGNRQIDCKIKIMKIARTNTIINARECLFFPKSSTS